SHFLRWSSAAPHPVPRPLGRGVQQTSVFCTCERHPRVATRAATAGTAEDQRRKCELGLLQPRFSARACAGRPPSVRRVSKTELVSTMSLSVDPSGSIAVTTGIRL